MKLKQLFCKHKYFAVYWYPLDKNGKKLFDVDGVKIECKKCKKILLIMPRDEEFANVSNSEEMK